MNGTRIWDYGEVWPGIRWGIIDYFRVPKMSYYALQQAQARLAISFAYEPALESQTSGTELQIPVWVINDYPDKLDAKVHCQILDLIGHELWSGDFDTIIPADGKKEVGTVAWVTPEKPGVYVLRARVITANTHPQAFNSTFIKVTPRVFSPELKVLLIGQKKYSTIIAEMLRAGGASVDVINEDSIPRLSELGDSAQLRKKYDVVWLAAFDSVWKLLDERESDGLKGAIQNGLGIVHTGGRASFHGGFGEGACLDFTSLAEVLPVDIEHRYDLVLGEADERSDFFSHFSPLKDVQLRDGAGPNWSNSDLKTFGVAGFNATTLKPGAQEIMSVEGRPLLVLGHYGSGRTVAFTGFTPAYSEQSAYWDPQIKFPYLLDQELYEQPSTKAYLGLFMELLTAASGQKPQVDYDEFLTAREKPLFELLKDLPPADVKFSINPEPQAADGAAFSVQVTNGDHYARLLRVRVDWEGAGPSARDLVLYDDNYFDLLPGESRRIEARMPLVQGKGERLSGTVWLEGTNVSPTEIPISLP
jgi:hypothetical protein